MATTPYDVDEPLFWYKVSEKKKNSSHHCREYTDELAEFYKSAYENDRHNVVSCRFPLDVALYRKNIEMLDILFHEGVRNSCFLCFPWGFFASPM